MSQAGLGVPDQDYYLQPGFAKQKQAYQAYVAQMLTLAGWPGGRVAGWPGGRVAESERARRRRRALETRVAAAS